MQYRRRMREQLFIGYVRLQGGRCENDERRIGYSVVESIMNYGMDIMLISQPFAELLRLDATHVVQIDLAKFPVAK